MVGNQVIRAVEFLFLFTLAAGLLVLLAAIGAQREGRAFELAVMRALGASERLLAGVQRAELLGMGALAGLLAGCAALLCGWALAHWVFEFEWSAPFATPLISAAAGALLAWAAGWPSLRALLRCGTCLPVRKQKQVLFPYAGRCPSLARAKPARSLPRAEG